MTQNAARKVVALPDNAKERRERRMLAAWAKEDELVRQLRDHRAGYRDLQRQCSEDQGYGFTVSREKLERSIRARLLGGRR